MRLGRRLWDNTLANRGRADQFRAADTRLPQQSDNCIIARPLKFHNSLPVSVASCTFSLGSSITKRDSAVAAMEELVDDNDIDLETLQAQIDLTLANTQSLVSSWVQPGPAESSSSKSSRIDHEKELQDLLKRPPR